MKKAKAVYHFLPVYGRHIFMGSSVKEIGDLLGKYYDVNKIDVSILPSEESVHGFVCPITSATNEELTHSYVMYVKSSADIGTVTHEATHLTNFIFDYLGQELDVCNDEAQAYLTGYLTQTFLEQIRGAKATSQRPLEKLKKKTKGK